MFDDKLSKDLLLSARANNNLAIIRILDDTTNIINPNLQDEFGRTALHWAVINLNPLITCYILKIEKVNVNIQDNTGFTVLHYLAKTINKLKFTTINGSFYKSNNYSILKTLFEYGIDVNIQDNKGNTALHYAICKNNFFFIEELLSNNTSPFILNKAGFSILYKLNTKNCNFKDKIIGSLHSKYPESIELGLVDNKIIIYDIHNYFIIYLILCMNIIF